MGEYIRVSGLGGQEFLETSEAKAARTGEEVVANPLSSLISQISKLNLTTAAQPTTSENDIDIQPDAYEEEDLYIDESSRSWLLYGGIALALAALAGGGYYYWFHMRPEKKAE